MQLTESLSYGLALVFAFISINGNASVLKESEELCNNDKIKSVGSTTFECENSVKNFGKGKYETCATNTWWMRDMMSAVWVCVNKIGKRELKKWKSSHKTDKLEALFRAAADVLIEANYCGGQAGRLQAMSSSEALEIYRTKQLVQMNQGKLAFQASKKRSPYEETKDPKLSAFLTALCRLPNQVYKGKKTPSNCVRKAFLDLETKFLGLQKDPCKFSD